MLQRRPASRRRVSAAAARGLRAGQTGAGKTYTLASMEADNVGMTPRALADIFNKAAVDVMHSYKVWISYVQIYMEVIKDLLLPSDAQLAIREDANGVFLSNVHEEEVRCCRQLHRCRCWARSSCWYPVCFSGGAKRLSHLVQRR
jgi:Kinesin motor domain